MQARSLALRLFILVSVWSAFALALAGGVLVTLHRDAVWRSFDDRLEFHLRSLIGQTAPLMESGASLSDPIDLGDARFELPLSGWYWTIRQADNSRILAASGSLVGEVLPDVAANAESDGPLRRADAMGPDAQNLRLVERTISIDGSTVFRFTVAGDVGALTRDVRAFTNRTIFILILVGLGLVIMTLVLVQIGLKPLEQIRGALLAIRTGEAERLEGAFPAELKPLASEMNALIEANREVVERARTQVGNLAHALKTPLSVVSNEARAQPGPLGDLVVEQARLMRQQVDHYLERARMAAQTRAIGVVTEVEPSLQAIARVMRRLSQEKGIAVEAVISPGLRFRGEQRDFEEIVGNLVDNACKWGRTKVTISAELDPAADPSRPFLVIGVDDDGPGLSPQARQEATKRGRRLDESVPGSGLGLSIVTDMVSAYGGRFILEASPLGGLAARVYLPAL